MQRQGAGFGARLIRLVSHDSARRMLQLSHGIRSRFSERVGRVVMRAHKIDWNRVFPAVIEELRNPLIVGGYRSTHLK